MPWEGECKWGCTEEYVKRGIYLLAVKRKYGLEEGYLVSDAEVDVFLACKTLKLKWSYKNTKQIMEWLNGER